MATQKETIILSINAGSSSVKISVFSTSSSNSSPDPTPLAEISISGLTAPPAKLTYSSGSTQVTKNEEVSSVSGPQEAYQTLLDRLISDASLKEITSASSITFACHRIVHGGPTNTRPLRINESEFHALEDLSDLAPLHNAGALEIVKAVHSSSSDVINVAFFDSAFHATLPAAVKAYAIDPKVAEKNQLRKYGFHGLSYAFISRSVARFLGKAEKDTSLIALHLGSGASACAIRKGQSVDTSMGLTPLAGLPGATRSGDVDASLIFHFTHDAGTPSPSSTKELHITRAEEILNKQSGWKALTGTTDFGEILKRMEEEGDERCTLAVELFVDRVVGFVGSYYVKLQGQVDGLVFAGGIGEKAGKLRELVVERVKCLGFELDDVANGKEVEGVVGEIGKEGAKHRVLVCQTDEQTEMARQCAVEADRLRG